MSQDPVTDGSAAYGGLDPALARWVEAEAGARVVDARRAGTGASRATWLLDFEANADAEPLVLRCDTDDGPLSGTELDLAREASVYVALRPTRVRIPKLVAIHPSGRALLIERVRGSDALASIADPETRGRVALDYAAALAELHRVPTDALELTAIERPISPRDHAWLDLRLWRRIASAHVKESRPLVELAFEWLEACAPGCERTALCHGDAGPGNFLFEASRVTALLDWEFAHLGDPLDDLAWVSIRTHLVGGIDDLPGLFAHWASRSGLDLDRERLDYYRALVLVRMATSCAVALSRAGQGEMDTTVYQLLLPLLEWLLPEALRRTGCRDARLQELERETSREIEAHPVLRELARPLASLELP